MRGRPKILLARTYQEALALYQKYKHNMLGIISDISIKEYRFDEDKIQGGVQLCKFVKEEDPFMPFVFQSSDSENARLAQELGVGFIHKYSKSLSSPLISNVAVPRPAASSTLSTYLTSVRGMLAF